MRRALRLALRSCGRTWPNPGVGCVLVRDGAVLAEGRHQRAGGPHAEVVALEACRDAGIDSRGATAYVTLAPCTSAGRTGACSRALLAAGVTRVVAAVADPLQSDAGAALAEGGVDYQVGCERHLAEHVHGGFLTRVRHGRPRLTGKWAMSADGFLALRGGESSWISSAEARAYSRRRRRLYDAILVGAGTARSDDPSLLSTVPGRDPLRVILSRSARLPEAMNLLQALDRAPVLVLHAMDAEPERVDRLRALGLRTRAIDGATAWDVARALAAEGLGEVLIEGGGRVHAMFLAEGLYDRIECYCAPCTFGGGLSVASGDGIGAMADATRWRHEREPRRFGDSILLSLCRESEDGGPP